MRTVTPRGAKILYTWDSYDRVQTVALGSAEPYRFAYATASFADRNPNTITDPLGGIHTITYGVHGQPETLTDPLGGVTQYSYDDLGNRSGIVLPEGDAWKFAFDSLSRLRKVTDPEGGIWAYEHDDNGELRRTIDPTGVTSGWAGNALAGMITRYDGRGAKVDAWILILMGGRSRCVKVVGARLATHTMRQVTCKRLQG